MSDDEAYAAFVALRFAETGGIPFCVRCKCPVVYDIKRKRVCKKTGEVKIRPMFKCADCLHQFSVTSGTSLKHHKLSFREMLHMVSLYTQGVKGVAALQMSRMTGHAYMTTFVFDHKLREGLLGLQMAQELDGVVEADSAYFGHTARMSNRVGPDGKRRVVRRTKK